MKKLFTIFAAVLLTATLWAQAPEKMSYQAVIRDASNKLVTGQTVGMQISILQGSSTGTAVYVETQTSTTNANGLVSIEIGTGITADDFSAIDWPNGTYFITTETDPTGGTSYTITGTSQLLSVPYALHAKTAETITGTIPESDPVFVADSSSFKTAIRTNTQAIQDTASQIRADIPMVTTYSIGDFAQGGIVFWVDETGQHGLACAIEDQNGGNHIQWYNGSYSITSAVGDGVYAGEMNTLLIIVNQGATLTDYAAGVCVNYSVTQNGVTYGDWYLPSKYELNLMYINNSTINTTALANSGSSFASATYWSSTEYNNGSAWEQYFATGYQGYYHTGNSSYVRAVRAF